jgi:3-hydroxybutyryl-CoA dehydrogenase
MSKSLIIIDELSPLFLEIISNKQLHVINLSNKENIDNHAQYSILYDFSSAEKQKKLQLYSSFAQDTKIFADLTCEPVEDFTKKFPNIVFVFSHLFLNESRNIECRLFNDNQLSLDFFQNLNIKLTPITVPTTVGFIYPRIISMIMNEATFLVNENIASTEDINKAMIYGVNYPSGPLDWLSKKEHLVARLLNNLFLITNDRRYELSPYLMKWSTP